MARPLSPVAQEATENVEERIRELLTPLLADRDQLLSEEAECKEAFETKKAERIRLEKTLRANGLIQFDKPSKSKAKKSGDIAPAIYDDLSEAAQNAIKAIEDMDGEPFQISMIEKETGISRGTVERAISHLRGEERLRLLGQLPQITRNPDAPGGRPAATFQEIK